jgi:hypothetical protein
MIDYFLYTDVQLYWIAPSTLLLLLNTVKIVLAYPTHNPTVSSMIVQYITVVID